MKIGPKDKLTISIMLALFGLGIVMLVLAVGILGYAALDQINLFWR